MNNVDFARLLRKTMIDRDLRHIAMQMASQLPDDLQSARRVHALLGELIEGWLFQDSSSCQPRLRVCSDEDVDSKVTRLVGNADISPR